MIRRIILNKSLNPSARLRTITSTCPAAASTLAVTAAFVVDCNASGLSARFCVTPVFCSTSLSIYVRALSVWPAVNGTLKSCILPCCLILTKPPISAFIRSSTFTLPSRKPSLGLFVNATLSSMPRKIAVLASWSSAISSQRLRP